MRISPIVQYSSELAYYSRELSTHVPEFPGQPDIRPFLVEKTGVSAAGMGVLGCAAYDIAHKSIGSPFEKRRHEVALTASRVLLLTDIVDTRIDRGDASLEDKFAYLDEGLAALLNPSDYEIADLEGDIRYRSSIALAKLIHFSFLRNDTAGLMGDVFDELVGAIKEQFTVSDPEEMLKLTKTIGACCVDAAAVLTEIQDQRPHNEARQAARAIGEYGQLLDHCHEIDDDLEEGSNTYATLRIRQEGDSPQIRREIRERYYDEAHDSYNSGLDYIDTNQVPIYRSLRQLLDFKYRVADFVKRNIKKYSGKKLAKVEYF